jgi:uncharacterized delta-60 repeat protein
MSKIFSVLTILSSFNLLAQPAGNLDPTFGNGGKIVTSITPGQDKSYGVAIQADGKILVAGYSTSSITGKDFTVVRYNSNGSIDNSFGNNGVVTTDLQAGSIDVANSVAIQTDGKIILAGFCDNGTDKDAAMVRYHVDGTIDNTFGNNGFVLTDFDNSQKDEIKVIKIHPLTGNILVGGSSEISTSIGKPVIARFLSNGTLDSSFNSNGIKLLWIATNDNNRTFSVEDLVVESNGLISCVGWRKQISTSISIEYWAARILNNGNMDNSFSTDGVLQYSDGSGSSSAYGLAVNSNQEMILCGTRQYFGDYSFRTLKINQNGTISNPSVFYTGYVSGINKAYKIAMDNNGKFVFVGTSGTNNNNSFTISRVSSNLAVDISFGNSGFTNTTFGNDYNECFNLAIQSDNKIIAIGNTGNDFAIARYLGNDTPDLNNFEQILPVNQSTNQNITNLAFDWSNAFGATSYEIDIDVAQNFSSSQTYTASSSNTSINGLLPNTQYYWRVRASDGSNWGSYSSVWSFTTLSLNNFNLIIPANNSVNQNFTSLALDWSNNVGATTYEIQMDTTQNFSTTPQTYTSPNSNFTVNLLPSKTYFWRVRAGVGSTWGQWTSTWNFTTNPASSSALQDLYFADLKIYPNPTTDMLHIESKDSFLNQPYKLIDNLGREIDSGILISHHILLSLEKLSAGMYQLQIGDLTPITYKVVKD